MKKAKKGFTLIELLIVVTILGILAAVILPRFTNSTANSMMRAHATEMQTINTQMELYAANNNIDLTQTALHLTTAASSNVAGADSGFGNNTEWTNYFPDKATQAAEGGATGWRCNAAAAWTTNSVGTTPYGRLVTSTHSGH